MPKPTVHTVSTLTEFTGVVEQLAAASKAAHPDAPVQNNWYRGVGLAKKYKLEPGLYRHPKKKKIIDLLQLEREMRDHFTAQSILHDFAKVGTRSGGPHELTFYMQHYGVPTRLLDWTYNPYIALFFALTDANVSATKPAAVWILDPTLWNSTALAEADKTWGYSGPVAPDASVADSYFPKWNLESSNATDVAHAMYDFPIAVSGISNSVRIFAQRGAFTCFGKKIEPMEKMYEKGPFLSGALTQILVPGPSITPMLEMLITIGFTDSVSYPDIHGLVLEIKRLKGFGT